jgi:hypothetical protein
MASALFMLMCVLLHAWWKRNRHAGELHYRYFLPGVYFKLFVALSFSLFYIFTYVGGGDTVAYWDGAVKLNNLFWDSPVNYLAELLDFKGAIGASAHFNKGTGYPPSWIYNEPESWLVCKIVSVFVIIGFKGYLALTFLFSYLSSLATWKFFELVRSFKLHKDGWLAVAILFIPSVAFWCSGISKDTLLYISLLLFICHFFRIIGAKEQRRKTSWIGLLFFGYLLWGIRPVMLMAALLPIVFALSARTLRRHVHSIPLRITMVTLLTVGLTFLGLFVFSNGGIINSETINQMIQEAAVVQQDFTNNTTYGVNRYQLDIVDYSLLGMVNAMPASIIAGLFRPFLWEAFIPSLFLNGLESLLFLFLLIRFFLRKKLWGRIQRIRKHELLIYLFFVMLFIAFFSGFTSILFGVLVRIRVFALPMLLIILLVEAETKPDEPETSV